MRRSLLLIALLLGAGFNSLAQEKKEIPTTVNFTIEGKVKHTMTFSGKELDKMNHMTRDSIVIFNHLMEKRKTLKRLTGVSLKDLLQLAEIDTPSPKELSEFYITCIAADGYKVVFSWNELFNTATGARVMVITGMDDKPMDRLDDHIALISPEDVATGRRYVKGLNKVVVSKVK